MKSNFFECLDFALQLASAAADEKDIRAKLAPIGVGAGKTSNFNDLPLGHRLEIGLGMKEGKDKIDKYLATEPKHINGWKLSSWFGDRRFTTAIGCCVQPARKLLSCDAPVPAKDRAAFSVLPPGEGS